MKNNRRRFNAEFKQEAIALVRRTGKSANQIAQWKGQLLEQAMDMFGAAGRSTEPPVDLKTLHGKIGALTLENDFLESARSRGMAERKAMIERNHSLPVARQARAASHQPGQCLLPAPTDE